MRSSLILLCCIVLISHATLRAQIAFPENAGLINVRDHNVKGDGATDDTAALQKVFDEFNGGGAVIYLPAGTYLISDTIRWQGRFTNTILQGQGQAHTIIRLTDAADGFADAKKVKPMFYTGGPPAQRFRNAVRDLTIDSGTKNPGAVGLNFCANNQGIIRDVTIRSGGDGKQAGAVGLALDQGEVGPLMVKNLTVIGFDTGVRVRSSVNSITMEDIRLSGQRSLGIDNFNNLVFLRKLTSHNTVPAVSNSGPDGVFLLIDSELALPVSTDAKTVSGAAIQNTHERSQIFVRNVKTSGYELAISDASGKTVPAGQVIEWHSDAPIMLFESQAATLNLPVAETPEVPWGDVSKWVNVQDFGAKPQDGEDDTVAIQRAIDSGAETIYFPRGVQAPPRDRANTPGWRGAYLISDTIHIRGKVKRLIGFEATFYFQAKEGAPEDKPVFLFEDGDAPVVVVERMMFMIGNYFPNPAFKHVAKRDLLLSSFTGARATTLEGSGRLFVEDVVGSQPWTVGPGSQLYARQLNIEGEHVPAAKLINKGGTAWVLGFKTEHRAPCVSVSAGGTTEILGAHFYTCVRGSPNETLLDVTDARLSLAGAGEYVWTRDWATNTILRETRDGQTRTLEKEALPHRGGGSMIGLVSAFAPAQSPQDDKRPGKPEVKVTAQSATTITLAITPTGAEAVGYRIQHDDKLIGLSTGRFVATGLEAQRSYNLQVIAYDQYNRASEPAQIQVSTLKDDVPPTVPQSMAAVTVTHRKAHLRWTPSTDELGIKHYLIERYVANKPDPDQSMETGKVEFIDETVARGTSYIYRVIAVDNSGNRSSPAEIKIDVLSEPPAVVEIELERPSKLHKIGKVKGPILGNLSEGVWATYEDIDMTRPKPLNTATLRFGAPASRAGAEIDLYLNATIEGYEEREGKNRADVTDGQIKGKLLGTFVLKDTGGFNRMGEVSIPVELPNTGTHSLTISIRCANSEGKNALGDLDKLKLSTEAR